MAKYCGRIGFALPVEVRKGVWEEDIVEHQCKGNTVERYYRSNDNSKINNDVEISMQISIFGTPFMHKNFHRIRYVTYMGVKWSVIKVEPFPPRLLLTIGGEYIEEH